MTKPQQNTRLRLLTRLFAAGVTTTNAVLRFGFEDIGKLPGVTADELRLLSELQGAIRQKQVIEFLSGADA